MKYTEQRLTYEEWLKWREQYYGNVVQVLATHKAELVEESDKEDQPSQAV